MKRKIIFLLLLSIGLASYGRTMALKECISIGVANNLSVANARIEINKGRTAISQNRARLLPLINGVFQFTDYLVQPVNVTTGTVLGNDFPDNPTWQTIKSMPYNANAGVQLNVPLYDQRVYAAIDVARTVEQLSRLSYDKAVDELTVQIGKVYYFAQSSQEQAALIGGNITRMEELYSITEAMYQQGVVLDIDLNRVNINIQNLKAQHDQYSTMYATHINMLRFLMDYSPDAPLDVERMADDVGPFVAQGVSDVLPELRAAMIQKDLVERKIRAVKAGYIPSISLSGYAGGLGYQDKFSHFFHTKESSRNWFGNCFIGLNITIPIFDANSKRLKIRQHRYEAEQAVNRATLLRNRIDREYSDALLQMRHNVDVYRTQSQSYRQARDVYNVTEEQYREGIASMTSILLDEMQLRTAQAACVQALCMINLARIDLLHLSGNLSLLTE